MKALSKFEIDTLREVSAIGAGSASTALSELTNSKIDIKFPEVIPYPIEKIPNVIGKPEQQIIMIYLPISGRKGRAKFSVGSMLLIFDKKDGVELASMLQKIRATTREPTEMDMSALKETGNILSGACLNALTQMIDIKLMEGLPESSVDMLKSTLDPLLYPLAIKVKETFLFKTKFFVSGKRVGANFIILFNPAIHEVIEKSAKGKNWVVKL
jgi:chemotaxis protein CheC